MNRVLGLLTLCVAFAVVRAVLVVLVAAAVLALLYAFVTRPRDTVVFVATVGLVVLASAQPLAFIPTAAAIAAALASTVILKRRRASSALPPLLVGRDIGSGS